MIPEAIIRRIKQYESGLAKFRVQPIYIFLLGSIILGSDGL
jgi:hypothetical protein